MCDRCLDSLPPAEDDSTAKDASPAPMLAQHEIYAPFTGRLDTLQVLKDLFLSSKENRSLNVVTLVGAPGVGKSRLALEFSRSVRAAVPDTRVLSGRAGLTTEAPNTPIIRLLSERFAIGEAEVPEDARAKIADGVSEVMPERFQTEVTHLLAHLMNFSFPSSPVIEPLVQVPGQLEVRTYIAVRRFLEKDCENGALLLFFDGADLFGAETANLIHYLADGLRGCPVCILATARPTLFRRHSQWGEGEFPHHLIELGPLDAREAEELFTALMHSTDLPAELVEVARDRLEGCPRAIEELTRYLVEVGVVSPTDDEWSVLPDRAAALSIPRTHEEILRARLRALTRRERSVMIRAAVVGEVFWLDAVVALLRTPPQDGGDPDGPTLKEIADAPDKTRSHVEGILELLVDRGYIRHIQDSSIAGAREYRFSYPPIWDLTSELIADADRQLFHRMTAQWLELRPEGRLEDQQEQAGRHLEQSGHGVMAASRFRRAADSARARFQNDRAIDLYSRALACLGDADLVTRIHLWHDLGSVYQLKGAMDDALDSFEHMLRLSWVIASRTKEAVAFNKMGRVWRQKGNLDLALEYLERGLDRFMQTGDNRGIATSLGDIGQSLFILGKYDQALDRSAKGLEIRRQIGDLRSIAESLSNIGNIEKSRGLFDEAESCFREAMQLRHSIGDRHGYAVSLSDIGSMAFVRGQLDQARDSWSLALTETEKIGALPLQMTLLTQLGEASLTAGKVTEAQQQIEQALALANVIEDQRATIDILIILALIELKGGNTEQASQFGHEALDMAKRRQMKRRIGRAYLTLGEVHAATLFDESVPAGGHGSAEDYFERSIKVFRELGNEPHLARALTRFGEYQVENDNVEQGRQVLEEALAILTRLEIATGDDVRKMLDDLS